MSSTAVEILSPVGDLDRLKLALHYGADAVYFGGEKFGLRTRATNFSLDQIKYAIRYTQQRKKKAYITINTFPLESEMAALEEYLQELCSGEDVPDALIMSDLGAIKLAQKVLQRLGEESVQRIPIHLSTQANTQSLEAAKFWYQQGVRRLILARETSLNLVREIKTHLDIEIEMFVQGSWCSAYSGHCTISNFTAGRDSNRGGCAHSCRFQYQSSLLEPSTFLSSLDLLALEHLEEMVQAGVDSLKIEGRMKNALYLCLTTGIYKGRLTQILEKRPEENTVSWHKKLQEISPRGSTPGYLLDAQTSENTIEKKKSQGREFMGIVLDQVPGEYTLVEVRKKFSKKSFLEAFGPSLEFHSFYPEEIWSLKNDPLESTKPSTLVKIPYNPKLERYSILTQAL